MDQSTATWDHCLQHAALSDVGLRRANNQDSMAVVLAGSQEKLQQRGHLFMVADGMGAHAAGELASKLATDVVPLTYHKLLDRPPPEALLAAIHDANSQINSRGQASEDFKGMGTTVDALVLLPQAVLVAHVGDSRAYRWRNNRLEQLTFDHSLVWELRAASRIPEDQIPSSIPKNVITRSMGPNPEVQVDLEGPFPLQVGDTFLLCSDGLSGPVKDEELGKILGCLPPDEAARALVDLANLRGGPDNITVIVARVTAPLAARDPSGETGSFGSAAAGRPVHPIVWILLGVFALAALGSLAIGNSVVALACLIGAVVAGVVALVRRYGGGESGYEFDGRPLGKGPHARCDCAADAPFVDRLAEVVGELRDAATNDDWRIDWSRFNAHHQRATAAAGAANYAEAIREHCHAISFMMDELKSQRRRKGPGGSAANVL